MEMDMEDVDDSEATSTVDGCSDEETPNGEYGYYDHPEDVDCVSYVNFVFSLL